MFLRRHLRYYLLSVPVRQTEPGSKCAAATGSVGAAEGGATTSAQAAESATADAGGDDAAEPESGQIGGGGGGNADGDGADGEPCEEHEAQEEECDCPPEPEAPDVSVDMVLDAGARVSKLLARAVAAKELASKAVPQTLPRALPPPPVAAMGPSVSLAALQDAAGGAFAMRGVSRWTGAARSRQRTNQNAVEEDGAGDEGGGGGDDDGGGD